MIALKIILLFLGTAFTALGYFIYFRKKYNLINGFKSDYKSGRKSESYAKRIGAIEFIAGIFILSADIILIVFM